jgi:hypothetical protein
MKTEMIITSENVKPNTENIKGLLKLGTDQMYDHSSD